jgi:predicted nuclease of restriction endonuclease-like (RecB) superfamily
MEQGLFDRVAAILDNARANVVRQVNTEMVLAYWHIGREIVEQVQRGENRAEYGRQVVEALSERLTKRYGKGYSVTNLKYFRLFYLAYASRTPEIRHKPCDELALPCLGTRRRRESHDVMADLSRALDDADRARCFSASLSWSHYRTLAMVRNKAERLFYETEAERERWSVPRLRRQIDTLLFSRLLRSRDKDGVLALAREGQAVREPADALKDPYVLDFLDLPEAHALHESDLEEAILTRLQQFLLELGKGFAFVARQKRLEYEDEHFYVDVVFYNCILKCYVLIDLKVGRLTHQDIGQMDSYVRLFDDRFTSEGDNPTVGLILCAEKNEAVARYSVLNRSKHLFAARYIHYLPTEEELRRELERERRLVEMRRLAAASPAENL